MKKTLIGIVLIFTALACSSKKHYENSGECIICRKPTNWNSIGYCNKHYELEKEQILRGVAKTND